RGDVAGASDGLRVRSSFPVLGWTPSTRSSSGSPTSTPQAELENQIDALLWEDLYPIPLYQQLVFLAYTVDLAGVELNGSQAGPLWNSQTWTLND
ncbi:MAG: hypothetical protein M3R66_18380, partial [Actinomycetota bacterium]|nr:hypothetical protein [Actinomycetota bacterium]